MSIKSKLKTFFFLDDEYDYNEEEIIEENHEPIQPQKQISKKQNVVSLQSVQKATGSKVVLVEPRVYDEAQEIADHLKKNRAVIVNLQRIDKAQAKRIIDFLTGTVYAIGGDAQRIGTDIFLCTPDNVEVSGNITQLLSEHDLENSRW
ncbi:cell division protein SepF [Cytobacillus spongiae]|jgi:cell division inhibitor SepF|uniref:cell division protein SepF n=1 Tax=Cytobacillus spongiae TaxID=2901381 RepID=UPI001F40F634|nr:cell division protein SepF [Cytobacillus spongiae]UII57335.1 cell division protein SepF [Cytobacillus spongiae]